MQGVREGHVVVVLDLPFQDPTLEDRPQPFASEG